MILAVIVLNRTGFARDFHSGHCGAMTGAAFGNHRSQSGLDQFQIFLAKPGRLPFHFGCFQHVRTIENAAVGNSRVDAGHLQRRKQYKTLPDRHVDRVAPKPALMHRVPFPIGTWQKACRLTGKIDAQRTTETEALSHFIIPFTPTIWLVS